MNFTSIKKVRYQLGKKLSIICVTVLLFACSSIGVSASGAYWSSDYPIDLYPPIITPGVAPASVGFNYTYEIYVETSEGGRLTQSDCAFGTKYNLYGRYYEYVINLTDLTEANYNLQMALLSEWFDTPHNENVDNMNVTYSYGDGSTYTITYSDLKSNNFNIDFDVFESPTTFCSVTIDIDYIDNQYHWLTISSPIFKILTPPAPEEPDRVEEILEDGFYNSDNQIINDSVDKFTSEFNEVKEQEDYILEDTRVKYDSLFSILNLSEFIEYMQGFNFIGTWFSNFYNSHIGFASAISMSLLVSILLILLRFRGR